MADEPHNVVSLTDRLPEGNPDIIADCRVALSEAQNGRIRSYVMLCVSHQGTLTASYYYDSPADELAIGTVVTGKLGPLTE